MANNQPVTFSAGKRVEEKCLPEGRKIVVGVTDFLTNVVYSVQQVGGVTCLVGEIDIPILTGQNSKLSATMGLIFSAFWTYGQAFTVFLDIGNGCPIIFQGGIGCTYLQLPLLSVPNTVKIILVDPDEGINTASYIGVGYLGVTNIELPPMTIVGATNVI